MQYLVQHTQQRLYTSSISTHSVASDTIVRANSISLGHSPKRKWSDLGHAGIVKSDNPAHKINKPYIMRMVTIVVGTISNAPTINTPPVTSSATSHYRTYLKSVYKNSPISPDSKWPPTPSKKYISLTVVAGDHRCRDEYIGHTLRGQVADVASARKEISTEQILAAENSLKLVLVEGAPGIGKSTFAWELCRKWEEFSCMQQYSLVILLRLREEEVQKIATTNQLFFSGDSETIAREVSANHGRGILFILDGFDELPKQLQQKGFLLDLIKGMILPESTVLVTSRPSATGELLRSCRPLIQKHVEVLGFTQESVETYAASIFSSEPEKLEKFKAYISASRNPAINSLMYVPLNAAIIVEIYRGSKSEHLLPHTLTELYTQLCLTVLNRHLNIHHPLVSAEKFEELPPDLYQQFLHLSKVAYENFKNEEIIFQSIPSNLEHFGFLDSVSALYGGGGVSFNFLHLTVQEFFAAYHISHLDSTGLEVFQQYSKAQRWNVVWRFVAGLTKFRYYEGHIDESMFIEELSMDECISIDRYFSKFLVQCLFEAQSTMYFLRSSANIWVVYPTSLDAYALGYCIANFPIGVPWNVRVYGGNAQHLVCGLNTRIPSVGIIKEFYLENSDFDFTDFQPDHLRGTTALHLVFCLTNSDMVYLSELIPHLPCLEEIDVTGNFDIITKDGFLKVLHQLSSDNSNVTSLAFTYPREILGELDLVNSHDHFTAFKRLIHPSFGKLEHLGVHDYGSGSRCAYLLSAPSSLKSLYLNCLDLPLHALHLKNNTNLTRLRLNSDLYIYYNMAGLIDIVNHNRTLEELVLKFDISNSIAALRRLFNALHENSTLQKIKVEIRGCLEDSINVAHFMTTHYKDLTLDSRIKYVRCMYYW